MPDENDDFRPEGIPHDVVMQEALAPFLGGFDGAEEASKAAYEALCVTYKRVIVEAEDLARQYEEMERLREENAYCLEALKGAENRRQAWRERAETAEPAIARARSLAGQLEAEAEQGLKTSVLDSQRAAWSAQAHVTGLFLAALDDTGEA